jgi:hypothetical protein
MAGIDERRRRRAGWLWCTDVTEHPTGNATAPPYSMCATAGSMGRVTSSVDE